MEAGDPTVCTTEVAALLHAMLYFSDSWPKQLHFLGSELTFFSTPSNTSSQVSESAWHLPVFSLEAGSYTKIVKAQIFPPAHILSAEPSFEYSPCLVPYIGNDSFWNWDSGRFAYRTHWKAI